ncbi:MAG TPA: universal stress protein [Rhizomicrobium sp.]|jgi:nucleotide-binding universal stress UspA family protein|nr:universal stress protein [Rhizomicrobium sp.]
MSEASDPDPSERAISPRPRKFLVVIDSTPECRVALRFATRRAQHTKGRVTLLCVAKSADFQQWRGVQQIMRDEAHQEAENLLYDAAKVPNELAGIIPELVIKHGRTAECLLELIRDDRDISILVLAAGTAKEGPGPLVSAVADKSQYPIPVTIVPGALSDEAVDQLA